MAANETNECWQDMLARSVTTPAALAGTWSLDPSSARRVTDAFPALINPYFASLIREEGDPIWRQVIPSSAEVAPESGEGGQRPAEAALDRGEGGCSLDPLREEEHSPVPGLVHRYPDRVLLLAGCACPVLCRFCTRRRRTGRTPRAEETGLEEAMSYLRGRPAVREVILSGGDPLLLSDGLLQDLLARLREIPHLGVIRIHSRVPGALPARVTAGLARLVAAFHPVWINLHFNHPRELTWQARASCRVLADAGIPLGSQTVLLAGVNDDEAVLAGLFRGLVETGVRPYYLFQADTVRGTAHFRVPLARALAIGDALRRGTSGIAMPTLAVDLPEGGGKVPLTRDRIVRRDGCTLVRGTAGRLIPYPDRE
jgi:lysine 2,3-aminomutase